MLNWSSCNQITVITVFLADACTRHACISHARYAPDGVAVINTMLSEQVVKKRIIFIAMYNDQLINLLPNSLCRVYRDLWKKTRKIAIIIYLIFLLNLNWKVRLRQKPT